MQDGRSQASTLFAIGDSSLRKGHGGPQIWFSSSENSSESSDSSDSISETIVSSISAAIVATSATAAVKPGLAVTNVASTSTTVTVSAYASGDSYEIQPAVIVGPVHLLYTPRRPPLNLSNDGPPGQYIVGQLDCLTNENDYLRECWKNLNRNEWLPAWVN